MPCLSATQSSTINTFGVWINDSSEIKTKLFIQIIKSQEHTKHWIKNTTKKRYKEHYSPGMQLPEALSLDTTHHRWASNAGSHCTAQLPRVVMMQGKHSGVHRAVLQEDSWWCTLGEDSMEHLRHILIERRGSAQGRMLGFPWCSLWWLGVCGRGLDSWRIPWNPLWTRTGTMH